jgi:hypothetical protein
MDLALLVPLDASLVLIPAFAYSVNGNIKSSRKIITFSVS